MKKIRTALILLIIMCLGGGIISSQAVYAPISAGVVDYTIRYMGTKINSELNYPLISYDNNTYIAVRDVAHLWNRGVLWDDDTQTIDIIDEYSDVDGYITALNMGKAIINKYYHDRINENTEYFLGFGHNGPQHPQQWILCVVFDCDPERSDDVAIVEDADAYVMMDSKTFDYFLAERKPKFKVVIDNGPIK